MNDVELQKLGLAARNAAHLTQNLGTGITDLLSRLDALLESVIVLAETSAELDVAPLLQQARDLSATAERLRDVNRAGAMTTDELRSSLHALGWAVSQDDLGVALMEWHPELSVLVDSMDAQHQTLIGHLNRLYAAILSGGHHLGVRETIAALQDYTVLHFRQEEALMESHGFPDYALQKAQHAAFTAQVAQFAQKVEDGASLDAEAVLGFLKDWLVNHIQKCDRCYGEFFRDQKITVN